MESAQEKLRAILAEAMARTDAAARVAYLDTACAGDSALRSKIEGLIQAYESHGSAVEQTLAMARPLAEAPGTVIGRYKLLEQIGEGGFGVVFMAEQLEPIRRRVALKIVKPGMDTKQVIARFEAERQALALMDHPNIAKVFDAGATETRRPYFVMELVHGVPLTQFCDANDLTPPERLRLFITVCEAVQHAHQKGIIHRDLKPSNILVTLHDGKPVPKVIDFGTAKALEHPLTEKTLFTGYGRLIGTPAYMSPEQAEMSGLDVDTRADIYSLGVLLYELLTGTTPLEAERLRTAAFDELMRIIREEEPPKPSTRVSTLGARASRIASHRQVDPVLLRRNLQGDLDWILMKALEKDRTRRYQAASALAEDVQRHLDHHPVLASPPGKIYLMRKFAHRHRVGVVIAASVTAALVLGLLVSTVGFIRANRERNRAIQAESLAQMHGQRLQATLHGLELKRARERFEQGRAAGGVALLAFLLRQQPEDWAVAEWLMNELTQRSFPLPVSPPFEHADAAHFARFSPDGRRVLTASRNNRVTIWETLAARAVAAPLQHDASLVRSTEFNGGLHPLHAAFSPDGRRVATGSVDNTARIWDAASGQPLIPPLVHSNWVTWVAFSPDGATLATACKDGSAHLWRVANGQPAGALLAHTQWVNFVKFSPDGRYLITGSDDATARLWEAASAKPVGAPLRHRFEVRDAAFSPDGRRVVTASNDKTAQLWDARTGEPIGPPIVHESLVFAVDFSPDGSLFATASNDRTARVWDGYDGTAVSRPIRHFDAVRSIRFSPEGERVVTASLDQTARVWDARSGEPLTEPLRHQGMVWSAEFSPDGGQVVTASSDKTVQIWDVRPGQALGQTFPCANAVHSVHWAPDGQRVLTSTLFSADVWDANTGYPGTRRDPNQGPQLDICCARFSQDGQRLVTSHESGTVRVWDAWGTRALTRRMRHDRPVRDVVFSPTGELLATACDDGAARLWDCENGAPRGSPLRHDDAVLTVRFSPDGATLLTGSADKTARLWKVATGQLLAAPLQHGDWVLAAEFSLDGQRVVTASKDGTAQVWDAATGNRLGPRLRHHGPVCSARFSPNGEWVVTSSEDKTAQVWEARTGRRVGEPLSHQGKVSSAMFCPEGKRVLTAANDGTAALWDARSGAPLSSPFKHGGLVWLAEFSPDGRWIATAGNDHFTKTWGTARSVGPAPAWLAPLAEAVVGERITEEGATEAVAPAEFFRIREQLAAIDGEDEYARWARWFLADRSARPVAPGATRTVRDHVQNLLDPWRLLFNTWTYWPEYPERLRSAARLGPTNALVFSEMASLGALEPLTNQARQLPTLGWLTERALSLGPEQPRSWAARGMYCAVAGETNAALAAFERGARFSARDPLLWFAWAKRLEQPAQFQEWFARFTNGIAATCVMMPEELRPYASGGRFRLTWNMSTQHMSAVIDLSARNWLRIPPRQPDCPPGLLDLVPPPPESDVFWCSLDRCWLAREPTRLDLRNLTHGRTVLDGTEFDIRCVLGWISSPKDWTQKKLRVRVRQSCRRLHFLHATDLPEPPGTTVAAYVIHYADGQQHEVPVIYGRDTLAWLLEDEPQAPDRANVAWRSDVGGGITLQLYKFTWENPRPDIPIQTLDFTSKETDAAPFLVALTAE